MIRAPFRGVCRQRVRERDTQRHRERERVSVRDNPKERERESYMCKCNNSADSYYFITSPNTGTITIRTLPIATTNN